jgi:3-hydroxy-D-aspartate aldolase
MRKLDILTPALLLDLDAFETNLARMIDQARRNGKAIRPHAKAHKCIEIARHQIAAGACGLCVATLAEAELMSQGGITGLLLTSPVADPRKIEHIVQTGAMVVVDHLQQVEWYEEAARKAGRQVGILVDLDVGDHRTGAASLEDAVAIAKAIGRTRHLQLRGLQAYAAAGSHIMPYEDRVANSRHTFAHAGAVRDALAREGMAIEIISGGSTGTWLIDTTLPEPTELQVGSFVLMDMDYAHAGVDFRRVITVLGTVVSANHQSFVTVDAGTKSFSTDRAYGPEAVGIPGSHFRFGGDEFGWVDVADPAKRPALGDKIEFIPPHCDPTVNLYDRIYACRGNQVEAVWPVKTLTPLT